MEILYLLNICFGALFLVCYAYQIFYIIVALTKKPAPHSGEEKYHNFAVLISARNEEKVIGELIDSINGQSYPSEYISVFVVADNCTDRTAEVAREAGAVVYERENLELIGKGYALDYLLDRIDEDNPRGTFDAIFVFDADNVLSHNYIEEMNRSYCDGYKILTSYRNSKNFGDNWITAGYALWFLREAKYLNNSRMILGSSCAISGTGFMIDRSIIEDEDGKLVWGFHLLTEDIEFSNAVVIKGERIGFSDAEFFDEQPTKFSQSWNQRMRWAKGYLQVFANYGSDLIRGIFGKKKQGEGKRQRWSRFSCFDMSLTIMPAMILSGVVFICDIIAAIVLLFMGKYLPALKFIMMPTVEASFIIFVVGIITTVTEWKKIHTTTLKKLWSCLTFPVFMITYVPIAIVAVFKKKVEWKHISHDKAVKVEEIISGK